MNMSITEKEFRLLAKYIRQNYGIHLKKEKKSLLVGRLSNILLSRGFKSFTEYYEYISSDRTGNAAKLFIDRVTTNHTYFMREAEHFCYFRDTILPYIVNQSKDRDLRIWSAGCSSGEEPYTLAMIINEFFGEKKIGWDTKILATDICNRVLDSARKGIYSNEQIEKLPETWKNKYFNVHDLKHSVITDKIKSEVIYRRFNLMEENFPFKRKFQAIFCRNVMIYFDDEIKYQLINKLYNMTEQGGYLFIGHSESLNRGATQYRYIMPAVYRKE